MAVLANPPRDRHEAGTRLDQVVPHPPPRPLRPDRLVVDQLLHGPADGLGVGSHRLGDLLPASKSRDAFNRSASSDDVALLEALMEGLPGSSPLRSRGTRDARPT